MDLRIAARTLIKSPGFTLTAVAALALGIGANTAIFSLVNQVLLHPPGIADPDRVVAVRAKYDKLNLKSISVSVPDFADVRNSRRIFEHAAAMSEGDFNYTGGQVPERLQGASVTLEWFDVFGAAPRLGRTFRAEEDVPGANLVVVLADAAWARLFGRDPAAVGRVIELNRKPYRIVGVMGPKFRWPRQVDLWAPLGLAPDAYAEGNRFNEWLFTVARTRPGVDFSRASAFTRTLGERLLHSGTPGAAYARDSAWGMFAAPMAQFVAGDTRKPLLVLMAAVGLVLLIACANIAGLLLARTSFHAREIAVRAALGAGRWRLLRQTLSESLLLAAAGSLAGLVVAFAGARLLLLVAPEQAVAGLSARIDGSVLLFTALAAVCSGVLFGLAPAWQIARLAPFEILKAGGRSASAGRGRQRLRAALVVGEMALALALLVGAGLFLRSLARLQEVSPGFEPRGVMTATLSLPETQYKEQEPRMAFYRSVTERLASLPQVTAAGIGMPLPFSGNLSSASFGIEGRPAGPGDPGPHGNVCWVTPGYFAAMRIPLMRGRVFTAEDRQGSQPVVLIDENLARQYWPNEDPVGRRIRRGRVAPWALIVGVVGHIKQSDLAGDTGKGMYYYPVFQQAPPFASFVVRAPGDPARLAPAIRDAVREADPGLPVHHLKTLEDMVSNSLGPRRFVMRLLGFFAVVALAMAALGLYGVISYSVAQRTQEIGIRMALGAQRRSVLALVVGQGLRLSALGVAIGLVLSLAGSRAVQSQLFGASGFDAATFAAMAVLLAGVAVLASALPARRATRVDPLEALRYE